MENFRKQLFNRQILLVAGLLLAAAALVFTGRFEKGTTAPESLRGFIDGFQVGIAMGLLAVLLIFAVKHFLAIRNPDRMKKLYIAETDERRLFIKQKTGDIGMNIISYGLVVGTAVAGNINDTVFLTLLGACLFVTAVRGFLKIFYNKKY